MFKPTQFGKYYLTERIAVGGMAELFKATLFGVSGFEKPMVVKQILPKYSKNDEFIRMFVDEAKIAVTLTHGNIVPVYELGRIEGIYFIAMEYIHGHDLADILETARGQGQPLSTEHAAYITIEICKGLDYAHRRTDESGRPLQVVHRDVSPPNILISFDGEVKIADFGIAKAAHKLGSTEAGVVKGTFGYMSPEQIRGLPLDHRTDIFSAGILLHEMLTGRRLFAGDSEVEAIERVKLARIPAPSSINPRVPAAIDPIVFKALAREPSERFADANELQLALSRFLFTAGKGATASTLSLYLRDLFADELEREQTEARPPAGLIADYTNEEPTRREYRPGSSRSPARGDAQSFAVSPALGNVEGAGGRERPGNGRQPQVMDVAPRGGVTINATLAYPALLSEEEAPPPPSKPEEGSGLRGGPQRPEVPALRFPPREARPSPAPVAFPAAPADQGDEFPSGDELAALADQLAESPRPQARKPRTALPVPPGKPAAARQPAAAPPITEEGLGIEPAEPTEPTHPAGGSTQPSAPATSGSELINLLAEETGGKPLLAEETGGRPLIAEAARAPAAPSAQPGRSAQRPASAQRPKRVSGLVSSTMRLFVQGFDEEREPPPSESVAVLPESAASAERSDSSSYSSLSGSLEVPRTIKPTVFGWALIGLVVVGAALFVLYKKTNLFGSRGAEDSADVLRPEDIRHGELTRPAVKGTIRLKVKTEGASCFFFAGETPTTLTLDAGKSHLIRVERDGFQIVHREIRSDELASGHAELKVTLQPVGAGPKDDAFEFKESGSPSGRQASVHVVSDPPVAMVLLLEGRGQLEMGGLDTSKSFNFKVVAPGHQPLLVNVSPADFDKSTGLYSTEVSLDEEGKPEPKAKGPAPASRPEPAATAEPKATPEPKARTEPGAKSEPKLKAAPRPRPEPRPKAKLKMKKAPKKAPPKKSKPEPKAKFQTPDWAR